MLELRRIKTYIPTGQVTTEAYDTGFKPPILFTNIDDMLTRNEKVIGGLNEDDRYNLYVTCNHVSSDGGKRSVSWQRQELLMWDIDNVSSKDHGRYEEYERAVAETLGVPKEALATILTGGGFHMVMQLGKAITEKSWFSEYALEYQVLCSQIDDKLEDMGLSGTLDIQVFAPNRMFRAPHSISKKPGREDQLVQLLSPRESLMPIDWDIRKATGLPQLDAKKDFMSDEELSYIKIDDATVEAGCCFLKWAKERPAEPNEPQWYAMLSIIGRLDKGKEKAHKYSLGHPRYNATKTDRKLEQSLQSSGPRTCDNINRIWGGCNKCKHYKKVRSPISLKGEEFIATAHSGFHTIDGKGKLIPQYDDLRKYYDAKLPYINASGTHYRFEKSQWNDYPDVYIENYAEKKFSPPPKNNICAEFKGKVKRTNLKVQSWFAESTDRRMNFKNGVLNIDSMELTPHDTKFGFTDTLPFDYDPKAECPEFRTMLDNVTLGDKGMQTVLMEFLGYCISNDSPKADKILVLTGQGQNGKSRFLNVWRALGSKGVRSLGVTDILNPFHVQKLDGALFNLMEEVPAFSDKNYWEMMKNLSSGGSVTASRKFKDPYDFNNRAKFVMTCNELPKVSDHSHAYFRRLLIADFKAKFSENGGNMDRDLDQRIIQSEMSGVANIAIKMYRRLKEAGYNFTKSDAMSKTLTDYQEDLDSVARWSMEHVAVGEPKDRGNAPEWIVKTSTGEYAASASKMRVHYANWCRDNGEKPVSTKTFVRRFSGIYVDGDVDGIVGRDSRPEEPIPSTEEPVRPSQSRVRVDGARVSVFWHITYV